MKQSVLVIDLWRLADSEVTCCLCGQEAPHRWGIPVDSEVGQVVANDYRGEWGCKPACESCWSKHAQGEFVGTWPRF